MQLVHIRPTHFTFHREGPAPRFRVQADEDGYVRLEFAERANLFVAANQAQRTPQNYFDTWAGGSDVAGQQLRLAQHKLSYELPLAIWRQMAPNSHQIYYRASATAQSPPNWDTAPPTTVRTVHDSWAATGRAPYFGVPHDRLYDPWAFPDMGALNQVPEYYRARLQLLTRFPETHEVPSLLRRLVREPNYTALPEDQRTKALLVFAASNVIANRALLQLMSRLIPARGGGVASPAVRSTDLTPQRRTLLDNLATLVTDVDPHMDISETMEGIIEQVLEEVADPHFELNQGRHGTCVPTSIQWILVTYHPAEYVRLLAGLLTQAGRANLANGDTASVPIDTYRRDPLEDDPQVRRFLRRSWPERFFQAAMMSYARPGFTYSNIRDLFLQDVRGGLTDSEAVRLIGGLRNVAYNSQGGAGANLVNTIAQRLQAGSMPVLTTMHWDVPPNQGYHAVVSVAFDAANITFRNPWGRMDYRVGQLLANPPRTCSNPSRGEEAITRGDLANWIDTIIIEQP